MIKLPENPNAVFLRDIGHSDMYTPAQNAGLSPPYSVHGFTDLLTHPSPYNAGLHTATLNADVLFVQDDLLSPLTPDSYLALCSLGMISKRGYRTAMYVFDDVYDVTYMHPSEIRAHVAHGWTPREGAIL